MWSFGLNSCPEFVELHLVIRLLYPGGDKSRRTTAGPVKTFAAVGLNLLKESEISAPQSKDYLFIFCHFIFNCNLYYLWYITPTILRRFMCLLQFEKVLISR